MTTRAARADDDRTIASPLLVRRVRFDWSSTELHWIPGDPQTTHTINVLNLLLPAGERWFVDVLREALPFIESKELADQIRGFSGQEATHSVAHARLLKLLERHGVETKGFTRHIERLFFGVLASRPFGRALPKALDRRWLVHRMAIIAAIEHHTAFLGSWVIEESQALDEAGADPTMLDLLRWHGAEEIEHRSVAFDAAVHLGAGWAERAWAMTMVTPMILGLWVLATRYLMLADPTAPALTLRNFQRAGKRGRLPTATRILSQIPKYARPGFHPSETGSLARAREYLAASRGARGASGAS